MSIHGTRTVDGAPSSMSSTRGELHEQAAMVIISNILLKAHNDDTTKTALHGDNNSVQKTCSHIQMDRLKHHRQPNMDLKLEFKKAGEGRHITAEWI